MIDHEARRKADDLIYAEAGANFNNCDKRVLMVPRDILNMGFGSYRVVCPVNRNPKRLVGVSEYTESNVGYGAYNLGCYTCKLAQERRQNEALLGIIQLHESIVEKCKDLFIAEHYSEAMIKGFAAVKDKLRELTGFERATDAFGKAGLYIENENPEHLDEDFQQGVKLVTMAIDRFRNVRSHTSEKVDIDRNEAFEYLALCSLAMRFLETTSTRYK